MEIEVRNLRKEYKKKRALDHFSCRVTEGINVLLGPNGAGKTTLMNSIADVLKTEEGEILLDGNNIRHMGKEYRKHLGYLPQNPSFYPAFTGKEVLEYFSVLKGIRKEEPDLDGLLAKVNLTEDAGRRCGGYSGGMLRRLGIAVAMLGNPDILILDEPTAGLDPKERLNFKKQLEDMAGSHIIILSTHIISDAEDIGNRVIVIRDGQNIKEGSIRELADEAKVSLTEEAHPLEKMYMEWFGI